MKNFIQRDDMISITAPTGGLISGQGVLVGNLFGVAAKTAAEGESVEIATVGAYELPKLTSAVIAAGVRVAWDDTASQIVLFGIGMVPVVAATQVSEVDPIGGATETGLSFGFSAVPIF